MMQPNSGPLSQKFMVRGLPDNLPPGNYVVNLIDKRIENGVLVVESDYVGPADKAITEDGPYRLRVDLRNVPPALVPGKYSLDNSEVTVRNGVLHLEADVVLPKIGVKVRYQHGGLVDASAIKVGMKVRLMWNGYAQVPHYLDGTVATVVKAPYTTKVSTHTFLRVRRAHGGTDWTERTILLSQVREIVEDD